MRRSPVNRISRGMYFLIASAFLVCSGAAPALSQSVTPQQKHEFEQVIRDYLLKHPEVIVEAMGNLEQRRRRAEEAAARQALAANRDQLLGDPTSPVTGDRNGDVVVVEFFDYRCGVCKRVHPVVAKLMAGDAKIRRVYKEWPILGPQSVYAARAALASRYQKKYPAFHNALMEARSRLTEDTVLLIAERVGIDRKRLVRDMKRPQIDRILKRNFDLAEKLKLNGTPSFVIGDRLLRGGRDLATMKQMVARARNRK